MNINLSMSAAPSIPTNYLVVAIYQANAPGTLIASQSFPAPHTAIQNITFSNVQPVVHIVIIYENVTNAPGGTIRNQFIYNPTFQNAITRVDAYLTVGITSGLVAGATTYTDASLIGWTIDIERRGYGTMFPGSDYTFNPLTGLITLTGVSDSFQVGENFTIRFQPQITTISPNLQVSGLFTTVEVQTANITLAAADMSKLQSIQGAADHLTITLPLLSTVADFNMLPFTSEGGVHINATILAQGTDQIKYLKSSRSSLIMGQSEELWLYKANGVWNVAFAQGNFKSVGEIVHSYLLTEENCLLCDGSSLSRLTYPRLWAYAQSLDASMLVSDTNWSNPALNLKAMFSTGDGSTTFRLPLLYSVNGTAGGGFLRGVDGATRKAGVYQDQDIQPHTHQVGTTGNQSSVDPGRSMQRSSAAQDAYASGIDVQGPYLQNTGVLETRPKNTGIYLLMRI